MSHTPTEHRYVAPDTAVEIAYVDEYLLLVNKPSGLLSVPGRGAEKQDCLIQRVQADYPDALIVHRLDMDTSGLMVMARNAEVHRQLSQAFAQRKVHKNYVALVAGLLANDTGTVDLPLLTDWPNRPLQKVDYEQGKPALTDYRVLQRDAIQNCTRVELQPHTGRTHQLRVHMAALGHAIIGDRLYANHPHRGGRLCLHATRLSFLHPIYQTVIDLTSAADF